MKDTIQIDGTDYPIKFGYGAIRNLGLWLNASGYDETIKKVNEILQKLTVAEKEGTGIPFEVTDTLGYLLLAGLDNAGENDFEHTLLVDFVLSNPDSLTKVFELFMAAMPKAKPEKKSPPKKRTVPKK